MNENSKNLKIKIASFAVAVVILAVVVYLLLDKTAAWLNDRGQWTDSSYTVGRIDYSYELNNTNIDTLHQDINGVVPIIGGVKINDSAEVEETAVNYQKYAEENFNEGVTLAHIKIINKSDFALSLNINFDFQNMFDSQLSQNIFYLIVPQTADVNVGDKTITLQGQQPVSYKAYVKSCMESYSTYDDMVSSLQSYYQNNPKLKNDYYSMAKSENKEAPEAAAQLNFYILFWSEYNNKLPFVENVDTLQQPNGTIEGLNGIFNVTMDLQQNK